MIHECRRRSAVKLKSTPLATVLIYSPLNGILIDLPKTKISYSPTSSNYNPPEMSEITQVEPLHLISVNTAVSTPNA